MSDIARLAEASAQLLERDGWCRQKTKDKNGARCMVQAMRDAAGFDYKDLRRAVEHLLGRSCLEVWNDHPKRQPGEAIGLLRAVALSVGGLGS